MSLILSFNYILIILYIITADEELHDLYRSPTIVRVIKSRRMRWAGYVARMGRGEACRGFRWGILRERDQRGVPGVDGRIILRWIFKK
jgi:hypothetical protein